MSTDRRENSLYKNRYRELVKAIEDIKSEINNLPRCWKSEDYEDATQDAIEIINRHIGERSNNDTEWDGEYYGEDC